MLARSSYASPYCSIVVLHLHAHQHGLPQQEQLKPLVSSAFAPHHLTFQELWASSSGACDASGPVMQIPTFGFLYIAGYIGHVGRAYINAIKSDAKPVQKEIIIDVPMALGMAFRGFAWPVQVVSELRAGTLTEKPENITVSPR
jgi:hypothetical protein